MRVVEAATELFQTNVIAPLSRLSVAEETLFAGLPIAVNVNAPARLSVNVWIAVLPL